MGMVALVFSVVSVGCGPAPDGGSSTGAGGSSSAGGSSGGRSGAGGSGGSGGSTGGSSSGTGGSTGGASGGSAGSAQTGGSSGNSGSAGGAGGATGGSTGGASAGGSGGAGGAGSPDAATAEAAPGGSDMASAPNPPASGQGPVAEGKIAFNQDFELNMDGMSRSPNNLPEDRIQIIDDPIKQRGKIVRIMFKDGDNFRTSPGHPAAQLVLGGQGLHREAGHHGQRRLGLHVGEPQHERPLRPADPRGRPDLDVGRGRQRQHAA